MSTSAQSTRPSREHCLESENPSLGRTCRTPLRRHLPKSSWHLMRAVVKTPRSGIVQKVATWTSKVPKIMAFIPKIKGIWASILGTLEAQGYRICIHCNAMALYGRAWTMAHVGKSENQTAPYPDLDMNHRTSIAA